MGWEWRIFFPLPVSAAGANNDQTSLDALSKDYPVLGRILRETRSNPLDPARPKMVPHAGGIVKSGPGPRGDIYLVSRFPTAGLKLRNCHNPHTTLELKVRKKLGKVKGQDKTPVLDHTENAADAEKYDKTSFAVPDLKQVATPSALLEKLQKAKTTLSKRELEVVNLVCSELMWTGSNAAAAEAASEEKSTTSQETILRNCWGNCPVAPMLVWKSRQQGSINRAVVEYTQLMVQPCASSSTPTGKEIDFGASGGSADGIFVGTICVEDHIESIDTKTLKEEVDRLLSSSGSKATVYVGGYNEFLYRLVHQQLDFGYPAAGAAGAVGAAGSVPLSDSK